MSVYIENISGLSTVPWGVPVLVVADNERLLPRLVYCVMFDRKLAIQVVSFDDNAAQSND